MNESKQVPVIFKVSFICSTCASKSSSNVNLVEDKSGKQYFIFACNKCSSKWFMSISGISGITGITGIEDYSELFVKKTKKNETTIGPQPQILLNKNSIKVNPILMKYIKIDKSTIEPQTLGNIDISKYLIDPQQTELSKISILKDIEGKIFGFTEIKKNMINVKNDTIEDKLSADLIPEIMIKE